MPFSFNCPAQDFKACDEILNRNLKALRIDLEPSVKNSTLLLSELIEFDQIRAEFGSMIGNLSYQTMLIGTSEFQYKTFAHRRSLNQ
jgi:hypothetical protein